MDFFLKPIPRVKSLPRPLNTPDGCNSLFLFFSLFFLICMLDWCMCVPTSMVFCCCTVWLEFWMNISMQVSLKVLIVPNVCFYLSFLFKCLSSVPLLPFMHKNVRCCSVNNFPVQISFCIYLLYCPQTPHPQKKPWNTRYFPRKWIFHFKQWPAADVNAVRRLLGRSYSLN